MEQHRVKIFIYLRLRCGQEEITRTKIREFRALGNLLADLTHAYLSGEIDRMPDPTSSVLEYVDANSDEVLLAMTSAGACLQVSGRIPQEYQERMLEPDQEESRIKVSEFVERAGRELDAEQRQSLAELASSPQPSLQDLIRQHLDADGRFEFDIPGPPLG